MATLFKRAYQLDIGKQYVYQKLSPGISLNAIDSYMYPGPQQEGYRFSEHNISFQINKTNSSSADVSTITIFNPTKDIVDLLESLSGQKVAIIFKAGYVEEMKELFRGVMESFVFSFEGETSQLVIKLGDGTVNVREATSSRVYPSGTPYQTIVNDLIADLGVPKAGAGVVPPKGSTEVAFYATGQTIDQLRRLSLVSNSDFSITDGAAWFLPKLAGIRKEVYKLNAETGLIGDIAPLDKTQGVSTTSKEPKKSVKFKCLLNGSITPNSTVYLESSDGRYNGGYKVTSVKHIGELEGTAWYSECEADYVNVYI